ncbi:MAG: hypothetical protein AVDCRST_MAG07-463, partial [uncultured Frankineae bacterium]
CVASSPCSSCPSCSPAAPPPPPPSGRNPSCRPRVPSRRAPAARPRPTCWTSAGRSRVWAATAAWTRSCRPGCRRLRSASTSWRRRPSRSSRLSCRRSWSASAPCGSVPSATPTRPSSARTCRRRSTKRCRPAPPSS